jgi:predicted transcriptional regulator
MGVKILTQWMEALLSATREIAYFQGEIMTDSSELSRRERQIMDAVFALGEATVNQVVESIPSPPTAMAVRRMMHILEEKGHLRRRESGREVVYAPRQTKGKAGRAALEQVIETFFGGSVVEALAAHLHSKKDHVSPEDRDRLIALIKQAEAEGR